MATELKIPNTGSFLLQDTDSTVTKIQLNSRSFEVLREAVENGMQLPASPHEFERRYERHTVQIFLERDPSVYDYVLEVFVTTRITCERFQKVINQEAPTIGRLLVRVADSAMELLGVRLNALAQEQAGSNAEDMLQGLWQRLEELSLAASDLARKSESIEEHIVEFKVKSRKNYEDAAKVNQRWGKAQISDEEWMGKLQQNTQPLKEEMRRLEADAERINAQARGAPREGSWIWNLLRDAPIVQLLNSAGVPIRSREELDEALNQLDREAENIRVRAQQQLNQFREASGNIEKLHRSVHDLSGHSEEVAAAIADVTFAASRLITDHEDLARRLEYLQDDLKMDAELETRLENMLNSRVDEISECFAMWKEVRGAGEKFSSS
ncbi:hypothetical protein B0J13DRAFT_576894 [Dactylonectria estremocensis]|uniref:Uncharacterized protein n=1 Tax=Dactylonectria estremocensis TaxID=1079267 RepID=A0A9P9D2V3_9HYPO|nr:hypothetical protein B0J13DRAFT_576894 [Dactylonectria estremocensis]